MYPIVFHQTIDLDLAEWGQFWGERVALDVQTWFPKDGPFPAEAQGMVIDLDHLGLTPIERSMFVYRLCLSLLPYAIAITSRHLEIEQIASLRERGFLVFDRIDRCVFDEIAKAIKRNRGGDRAA